MSMKEIGRTKKNKNKNNKKKAAPEGIEKQPIPFELQEHFSRYLENKRVAFLR